jgi:arylsulfatase A-like enzyme
MKALSQQFDEKKATARPNLILFLTDDQRWDTLGCMGNPIIHTPNLDRLATQGVLFTNNFCTTSICMSSRASVFTGMYSRRHQINDFSQPLPDDLFVRTYPLLLRKAGYRTAFVGKWGLGGALPEKEFDFFDGFPGQGQYFHTVEGKTLHLTRLLTDKAIGFLRGCSSEQPFCLSVSFKAPHVQDNHPRQFLYNPVFEELYKDTVIPVPKTADPRYFNSLPEFIRQSEGRTRWQRRFSSPELFQEMVKGYYRLITGVDVAIGKIMTAIEEMGLYHDTVILFTSDNGFYLGEHGLAGKWLMHEESIRTPLIIRDPRLPLPMRGRRCEEMALNVDIAPTLLDFARVAIPRGVQGRSLRPLLAGAPIPWREEWFYEHLYGHGGKIPRSEGVRTRNWKYVRYLDAEPPYEELYNLKDDVSEENNLVPGGACEAILAQLRGRWRELRDTLE